MCPHCKTISSGSLDSVISKICFDLIPDKISKLKNIGKFYMVNQKIKYFRFTCLSIEGSVELLRRDFRKIFISGYVYFTFI